MNVIVPTLFLATFLNIAVADTSKYNRNKVIRILNTDGSSFLKPVSSHLDANELPDNSDVSPELSLFKPAKVMLKSTDLRYEDKQGTELLVSLLKAMLETNENKENNKKTSSLVLVQPQVKKRSVPIASTLKEITMQALKYLDRQNQASNINENGRSNEKSPSLVLVQPKGKQRSIPPMTNTLKDITLSLLENLVNEGLVPKEYTPDLMADESDENKGKSSPLIAIKQKSKDKKTLGKKFKEITMQALDFLETENPARKLRPLKNNNENSGEKKDKGKKVTTTQPWIGVLEEINQTSQIIDSEKPSVFVIAPTAKPEKQDTSIKNIIKEAAKRALSSLFDGKYLGKILTPLIKLLTGNKKRALLNLLESKTSADNNLEEIAMKALSLLNNGSLIGIKEKRTKKKKSRKKKEKKRLKQIQDLLNSRGQIEFKTKPEASLYEKTKKIEDFLNSHIPVINAQSYKEDTSQERRKKVQDFLDHQIPGVMEKLSLDDRVKYIQDFLNDEVPMFVSRHSFKNQNKKAQAFSKGKKRIHHSKHVKHQNQDEEASSNVHKVAHLRYNNTIEEENHGTELFDHFSADHTEDSDDFWRPNFRRNSLKKTTKYRVRETGYSESDNEQSDVSASSDYEKNPGNPYTIHRNKYMQNWMWNHYMDGDHMNINPFGPPFANLGPSGADLFFGRKWWYFNQDDYKPMG